MTCEECNHARGTPCDECHRPYCDRCWRKFHHWRCRRDESLDPILAALREALPAMTITEVLRYHHRGTTGVALYRRVDDYGQYVIHGLTFGDRPAVGSGLYFRERAEAEAAFVRATGGAA